MNRFNITRGPMSAMECGQGRCPVCLQLDCECPECGYCGYKGNPECSVNGGKRGCIDEVCAIVDAAEMRILGAMDQNVIELIDNETLNIEDFNYRA